MEAHPECSTEPGRTPLKHWPCQFPTYLEWPTVIQTRQVKPDFGGTNQTSDDAPNKSFNSLGMKLDLKAIEDKKQNPKSLAANVSLSSLGCWQRVVGLLPWAKFKTRFGGHYRYLTCGNLKITYVETQHNLESDTL